MDSFTFDGHQTPEAKGWFHAHHQAKGWFHAHHQAERWRKAQAEEATDAEAKGRFLFPECHGSFPEKR